MLRLLSRRFSSAKYIYSVHLHGISPWFMHERPAKVVWKRGTQKKKRGSTAATMPVLATKQNMNFCKLEVDERFEIEATLIAENSKCKETGPYGSKEMRLVIMEIDEDGDIYSFIGSVTINLDQYTGLADERIKVPVKCGAEIIEAIGQPYFDITISSCYKRDLGGGMRNSGKSSSKLFAQGSDAVEEVDRHGDVDDRHLVSQKTV